MALGNGTNLLYIHQDILGSTSVVTDSFGTEYGYMKYYPYGLARLSDGSLGTDKEFTGQRLDGTGLYYYNARYYDPTIGRFISADTIVPDPADPQSFNRYSYCINNPLRYTDPDGHFWFIPVILAIIGVASTGYDVYQAVSDPSPGNFVFLALDILDPSPVPWGAGKNAAKLAIRKSGQELGEQGLKDAAKVVDNIPSSLLVGPSDTHVYFGVRNGERVYVGIAKNVERRATQYGERFTKLEPLTRKSETLTRRQARAIEQAIILRNKSRFENIRNSISPNQKWYNEAVEWGETWLQKMGY